MKQIKETANFIKSQYSQKIDLAIILGSGLSNIVNNFEVIKEINFESIPNFEKSNIAGHESKVIIAKFEGKTILALKGRFHYYEGYDISKVILPVRVFKLLGIEQMIVTNACGGISEFLNPGDIMFIKDHIGLFCPSPLIGHNLDELGPRFLDMSEAYNSELREKSMQVAKKNKYWS